MKPLVHSIGKNALVVLLVSIGGNLVLYGPEATWKRGVAMYEKPESTLYPLRVVLGWCLPKTFRCMTNSNCRKTVDCMNECNDNLAKNRIAACCFVCEMTHGYENQQFEDLVRCMVDNGGMPKYPDDGICYGTDEDGVRSLQAMEQIEGDWWVIRGLNCGKNDDFPGGYDWYPCQHARYVKQESGQWINNVTYCDGKDDACTTPYIITIANVSLPHPGVVLHEYTDSPVKPQTESWRVVSWPNKGDFLFMLWCGKLPIMDYGGGIVLSRQRNDKNMPVSTEAEFKEVAKKFGVSWEQMCPSNNNHCKV